MDSSSSIEGTGKAVERDESFRTGARMAHHSPDDMLSSLAHPKQ